MLELVAEGSVTLTTVALLRPHLTERNHEALLAAARHKSKRDVEQLIAGLAPRPDAKALIRRLPTQSATEIKTTEALPSAVAAQASVGPNLVPASGGADSTMMATVVAAAPVAAVEPRPKVAPLAADRYLLRVTLSADTHAKLRRAQELMSHRVPDGNPAVILDKALSLLVAQLERMKVAHVSRPRVAVQRPGQSPSGSRHIPAAVRRQVWSRDDGRCAFVGSRGPMHRDPPSGVPSRRPIRARWSDDRREHCAPMPCPQCPRERTDVWSLARQGSRGTAGVGLHERTRSGPVPP